MTLYGVRSEGMTTLIVTLFLFNESGSFRGSRTVDTLEFVQADLYIYQHIYINYIFMSVSAISVNFISL